MIPCAISEENKKNLAAAIYKRLAQTLADKTPFNLDNYLKSFYDKISKNMPQEKALTYLQLTPGYIHNIVGKYPLIRKYLTSNGLSLDALNTLDNNFTESLDNVAAYLGRSQGTISNIEQQKNITAKVVTQSGYNPNPPQEVSRTFHAAPVNALSTTGQEALQGNIPDPSKTYLYDFQRKIINEVLVKGDSTKLSPALYLTAQKGPDGSPVFAVTDQLGSPYFFNEKGEIVKPSSGITFTESTSAAYPPRTYANAKADATIALATDFDSAGEKLTKKAVLEQGKKYISLGIPQTKPKDLLSWHPKETAVKGIVDDLNSINAKTLNIAGNGIYTMRESGYTQPEIDEMVYRLIKAVLEHPGLKNKIESIRSGGQTGVDEAGAKAGVRLGIPTEVHTTKGWRFRPENGKDISEEMKFKARFPSKQEGKLMYYPNREVTKEGDAYSSKSDLAPVSAIIKSYALQGTPITKAQAEQIRQDQLELIYDINQAIKEGKDLRAIITGGSLGYTNYAQSTRTSLTQVNFSDSPLIVEIQQQPGEPFYAGAAYFRVKGLQDPILIQRNDLSPELIEKIASTFTDPINETHAGTTYAITPQARLNLIKQYLNNTPTFMTTLEEGSLILHLNESGVDLNSPQAKQQIIDYLSTYQPTPGFDQKNLSQEKKDKAIDGDKPGYQSQLRQGAIVKFTDQSGKVFYEKFTKPAFNINNDFIKSPGHFNDYSLEKQADGSFTLKPNPSDYIDWLKKNTYINYELNKEGKILALNSYFTFRLTDDSLKTLYPKPEPSKDPVAPVTNPGITDNGSGTVLPPSEAIRSFIDKIKKQGLKKETPGLKATEDQIAAAKDWYEKHPLSKHFPFQSLFNVVNSDRIAQWTMDGITLFQGSDYSDLYHESWHGFTQGFLTKDQKRDLYNEAKKISGSFTTLSGKQVQFSKASYEQIEELLGEDFRKYMLSGAKLVLDKRPVRNTIFRKIYAFLKSLFGNTTYAQALIDQNALNTIKELYEKLRVGNINEYSFSAKNSMFDTLGKGIKATDSKDSVQELSPSESMLAVNTVDSLFSSFVDEYNRLNPTDKITNHIFASEAGRQAAYESVLDALETRRKQLFWENTKETNPLTKQSNENNLQTLDWMIKNFGDVRDPRALKSDKGLIAYHNRKSKFLSYEDKFIDAEEKNLPESYNFKDGNETSVFEKGRPEVWYLIRGLHKLDKAGNPVLNKLGFPELVDFSSTKNRLIKTLQDSYDPQEMQQRLIDTQKKYPFVTQLLTKLGDPNSTEKYELGMWSSFFQTFNRYREPQMTVIFDKQGNKFIAKVGEAYGDHKQVQRQWDQLFFAGISGNPDLVVKKGNERPYLDITKTLAKYPKVNRTNILQFLNDIGVPIERDNEDIQLEIKEDPTWDKVGGYLRTRLQLLQKNKIPVDSLTTLFKLPVKNDFGEERNESSRYDSIARLQVKYSDQYSNFSVTTPTGDTRYEHSLNSSMTSVAKGINRASTYQDLLNTSLAYLDKGRNPFAAISKQLDALFKPDGTRTDVKYLVDNLNGTTLTEEGESLDLGTSSSGADEYTKFVQDLHLMYFKGVFENPRHGEKSTSLSTRPSKYNTPYSKDKRYWMGPENFLLGDQSVYRKIYDSIIPYLKAEHQRVLRMNSLKSGDEELNYPDYVKNGKGFVLFDTILSQATKDELLKNTIITPDLETKIDSDFRKYWDSQFDRVIEQFSKADFLADNLIKQVTDGKDNPLAKYKNDKKTLGEILTKAFAFNSWIHNVESSILNYGDLAQYKTPIDFHKRIAMFSSTGDIFRTDNTMMSYLNNQGMGYAQKNNLPIKTFTNVLGTAIMKDPLLTSVYYDQIEKYLKMGLKQDWDQSKRSYTQSELDSEASKQAEAYKNMKIGDAQGWITFDSYRALSIAIDKWSEKQEDLYQRIINGETIPTDQAIEYFPVRKYQYAGPLKTKEGLPVMAGHKFSLMPLIPSVIKDSPILTSLHHKMISQGIDYATLHSGSKITTVTNQGMMDEMYEDFALRRFDPTRFTPNYIYLDFLKDQQDINSEYKGNAIFSTQLRKVIEEGLIEGGVPTDFQMNKSLDERRSAWAKLSESQRLKSPKYTLYKAYEDSISRLTQKKKDALIKEIGWDKPDTYGKVNQNLIDLIQNELTRQDISDHELDYIKLKQAHSDLLKYGDLSIHLSAEKIEKLLASLVNRRLVRQKISGEPLVQVSGLGWEQPGKFANPTEQDLQKWGSNDLPFYEKGKGPNRTTSAMKVKVSLQGNFTKLLNLKDNKGNLIGTTEKLNELLKDETWLNSGDNRRMITLIGTRIPVQGLNSMEFMEVHEFLPPEAGNIIIPPAEIVAKSGSDFDIDKLTVMIPNVKESKDGTVSLFKNISEKEARKLYDEYKKEIVKRENPEDIQTYNKLFDSIFGFSPDELQQEQEDLLFKEGKIKPFDQFFKDLNTNTKQEENEVMWNMRKILEHPDNYASLVRPNATFTLGPIADDKFRSQVSDYDPKQGGSSVSGSRLMEYQYNLYVHQINKVAKEALAIAAVDNTFNIMFNRVGAHMNEFYMDKTTKAALKDAIKKTINLYLPHNTLTINGKKVVSLSHIMDAEGKHRISDNVSQVINLLLEIAKNDSAYYLQLNKEVIPTLLFLNQAGVPIDTLEYLVSQPIIRDYMNEVRLAKSPIADPLGKAPSKWQFFQLQARAEMIKKYFPEMEFPFVNKETGEIIYNTRTMKAIQEIYNRSRQLFKDNPDSFDRDRLKNNLTNKNFSDKDKAVLLHWFEIEDMAKAIRDVKMRLNFDTKKTGSAFLAMNKNILIDLLEQDQRIPNSIVEGILNESPIASLKAQDFMIDFLKPLFPTRANTTIGNFLLSKVQAPEAREEIENTFGDIDKFSVRFFNDLVSYIFQNKLRDFDPHVSQYRNMNTTESLDIQQIPYLKFGAFVKDNTLYYDLNQMIKDFSQKNYTTNSYSDRGLAKVDPRAFKTAKEFYNFVFEREYIRSYTKLSDVNSDQKYLDLLDKAKNDKLAYEQYIRDRALENIGNGWKLFESPDTYANQVIRTIQEYDLTNQYPLLNTLSLSESKGKTRMQNLQLLDTDLTSDKIDSYHQVLSELADSSISKTPDEQENIRISNLFQKFPMVAFLQSGLNTSGSFSLVRLVPADNFMSFMQGAVKDFTRNLTQPKLERFYKSFISLNQRSSTRNRYKDYTVQSPGLKSVSKSSIPIYKVNPEYSVYDPTGLNKAHALAAAEQNPDNVFVYYKGPSLTLHLGAKEITSTNTLGIPSMNSDKTLEKNKTLIDEFIQNLKDLKDSGLTPTFSTEGYGQDLIGLKPDGETVQNKNKPGLQTFLYLSEQLFDNFDYVNKNYDVQQVPSDYDTPAEVLAQRAPITDEEVRNAIKNCFE